MIDWFAYAEQAQDNFIEHFADLDINEHPDKVMEIAEAKRLRQSREDYAAAIDEIVDKMKRTSNPDCSRWRRVAHDGRGDLDLRG